MTWEYLAGFFDGEGSVVRNRKGFRIYITQTNKEVLESIRDFVGKGYIIEPRKRKPHWKDCWVYYIAKQEDVYNFLRSVSGPLIVKKDLANLVMPQLKNIVLNQHNRKKLKIERIKIAKKLRKQGLTYRQIGKIIGIDFGYARLLALEKPK